MVLHLPAPWKRGASSPPGVLAAFPAEEWPGLGEVHGQGCGRHYGETGGGPGCRHHLWLFSLQSSFSSPGHPGGGPCLVKQGTTTGGLKKKKIKENLDFPGLQPTACSHPNGGRAGAAVLPKERGHSRAGSC